MLCPNLPGVESIGDAFRDDRLEGNSLLSTGKDMMKNSVLTS